MADVFNPHTYQREGIDKIKAQKALALMVGVWAWQVRDNAYSRTGAERLRRSAARPDNCPKEGGRGYMAG